jgi:hypothetical protein
MSTEEEIKDLEKKLEELRKNKGEVLESFSHVPDIQGKILRNLETQERLLLELIREKQGETGSGK